MRLIATLLVLAASLAAQSATQATQVILDNEFVRVSRVTSPAENRPTVASNNDTVLVNVQGETAQFAPKGSRFGESSGESRDGGGPLLVEIKKHWEAEIRPCAYPMKCTHETLIGNEPIAWSTTLFTNGFVTATTHKVKQHGSLTSSYYTAKGADRLLLVPFTTLKASFGGIEETLSPGEPYFSAAAEVEVNAGDTESRWFVLRLNIPK